MPDQTDLRDLIAAAIWAQYPDAEPSRTGLVLANPHAVADVVLAVLRGLTLRELEQLARPNTPPSRPERRCPAQEPLDGAQCLKRAGHEVHSDRPGRIWYPVPDSETPFVTRVLDLFAKADSHGELLWRVVDGQPEFAANVSDVFAWGGADAEDITPDTLPVLEQAFADLKAIDAEHFTADLYAARLRKMRPQGAAYPDSKTKNWREVSVLYDACGPERELGLGNPKAAPAHRGAPVERAATADAAKEERRG